MVYARNQSKIRLCGRILMHGTSTFAILAMYSPPVEKPNSEDPVTEKGNEPVPNYPNICVYVLILSLCTVPLALDIGTAGSLMASPSFAQQYCLSAQNTGPVILIFQIGCMCGCCVILWGRLPSKVGYLHLLRIGFAVYQLGAVALGAGRYLPRSVLFLAAARLLFGVSCGMLSVVAPVLITHMCFFTSHKHDFLYACHLTTGVVIVASSCLFLVESSRVEIVLCGVQLLLPVVAGGLSYVLPAPGNLQKLVRNIDQRGVQDRVAEIFNTHAEEKGNEPCPTRLMLCCTLLALQQLTGAGFFFYFGSLLFEQLLGKDTHKYSGLLLSLCNLAGTLISFPLMRLSLQKSLLCALAVNTLLLAVFTVLGALPPQTMATGYAMLAIVCIFQFVFASSWGPYVGIICVDISNASSQVLSTSVLVGWGTNILVMATMPALTRRAGYGSVGVFLLFSALLVVFVWRLEPPGPRSEILAKPRATCVGI